jgi:hypothetical protein
METCCQDRKHANKPQIVGVSLTVWHAEIWVNFPRSKGRNKTQASDRSLERGKYENKAVKQESAVGFSPQLASDHGAELLSSRMISSA